MFGIGNPGKHFLVAVFTGKAAFFIVLFSDGGAFLLIPRVLFNQLVIIGITRSVGVLFILTATVGNGGINTCPVCVSCGGGTGAVKQFHVLVELFFNRAAFVGVRRKFIKQCFGLLLCLFPGILFGIIQDVGFAVVNFRAVFGKFLSATFNDIKHFNHRFGVGQLLGQLLIELFKDGAFRFFGDLVIQGAQLLVLLLCAGGNIDFQDLVALLLQIVDIGCALRKQSGKFLIGGCDKHGIAGIYPFQKALIFGFALLQFFQERVGLCAATAPAARAVCGRSRDCIGFFLQYVDFPHHLFVSFGIKGFQKFFTLCGDLLVQVAK